MQISHHGDDTKTCFSTTVCKDRISGVVNFVTGNLRPVKSETDPDLSNWYKKNSLVFVASDHACWSNAELVKKVGRRRFGGVRKSPQNGLNRMMEAHMDEVDEWVKERLTPDSADGTEEES